MTYHAPSSIQCDYFRFLIATSYFNSFNFSYPSTLQITPSLRLIWKLKWQKILKDLCRMQLSPTVAINASTRVQQLLISRSTCGNILEKGPSNAINAVTLANKLLNLRCTYWFIQVKSLSCAIIVVTPALLVVTSGDTCWLIQEKSLTNANNVITPAKNLVRSRDT